MLQKKKKGPEKLDRIQHNATNAVKSLQHNREQAEFIQLEEKMLKEGFNTCLRLPKRTRGGLEMSQALFYRAQQKDERQQASLRAGEILVRYQEKLHTCSPPRGVQHLPQVPRAAEEPPTWWVSGFTRTRP